MKKPTIKQLKKEISKLKKENRRLLNINTVLIFNRKKIFTSIIKAIDILESQMYGNIKISKFIYETRKFLYNE